MEGYTEMLQKLIPELLNIFQGSINSIILYGSVACSEELENHIT